MLLSHLTLSHFRSYKKASFDFDITTIIIGKNTAGKTNILESIGFLSLGKSFRAIKDTDVIAEGSDFAKIEAVVKDESNTEHLDVILAIKEGRFHKKFLRNNVPKRHTDFNQYLITTLFTPEDVALISDSPGTRRSYIDTVLVQASKQYRTSKNIYEKGLRQRNKLLYLVREGKKRYSKEEFTYWNTLLIEHGSIITHERNAFIEYINASGKNIFNFHVLYDKSTITEERLLKYGAAEQAAAITLIGPQRDDFVFYYKDTGHQVREYCSRGEQRLTVVQTKLLEIEYLKQTTQQNPLLLLDDIFSELDSANIEKVLEHIENSQTIITTTHKEFVPKRLMKNVRLIELT